MGPNDIHPKLSTTVYFVNTRVRTRSETIIQNKVYCKGAHSESITSNSSRKFTLLNHPRNLKIRKASLSFKPSETRSKLTNEHESRTELYAFSTEQHASSTELQTSSTEKTTPTGCSSGCTTDTSGPRHNRCCVFPFIYEGVTHSTCIEVDGNKSWCSTKVDQDGAFIETEWGYCGDQCVFKPPLFTMDSQGRNCYFSSYNLTYFMEHKSKRLSILAFSSKGFFRQ